MRKVITSALLVLAFAASLAAQITIPYSFTAGTVIDPDQMNSNFTAVAAACNRTGCTMTAVLKAIAGTAGAPGIANSTDPTTGVIIGATGTIGWSLSGTQRLLLDGSGLTLYGQVIANASGQLIATRLTGTVPTASLGSGSATTTTWLRGDSAWTAIAAPVPVAKVANYTAVANDLVLATGTFTVTLPAAASSTNMVIDVKNVSTGTVTIGRTGADTIDGATSQSLAVQYQSMTFISDGTNWWIK